jgi:hypothetical protein
LRFFVKKEFFEVFFRKLFEKYEISHQTVVFVETTTQIPKSGDKHCTIYSTTDRANQINISLTSQQYNKKYIRHLLYSYSNLTTELFTHMSVRIRFNILIYTIYMVPLID